METDTLSTLFIYLVNVSTTTWKTLEEVSHDSIDTASCAFSTQSFICLQCWSWRDELAPCLLKPSVVQWSQPFLPCLQIRHTMWDGVLLLKVATRHAYGGMCNRKLIVQSDDRIARIDWTIRSGVKLRAWFKLALSVDRRQQNSFTAYHNLIDKNFPVLTVKKGVHCNQTISHSWLSMLTKIQNVANWEGVKLACWNSRKMAHLWSFDRTRAPYQTPLHIKTMSANASPLNNIIIADECSDTVREASYGK